MDLTKVKPTMESLLGGKTAVLLSVRESFAFDSDNHATQTVDGYRVEVVLPENSYEKLTVKVMLKPMITQEQLDAAETPIRCTFDSFDCRIYRDFKNGGYGISCRAKAMQVVK